MITGMWKKLLDKISGKAKKDGGSVEEKLKELKENGVAETIVKKRNLIKVVFAILFVVSLVNMPLVKVNYDLTEYLPDNAESKQSIDLMEQEFGYPGTARVMIKDVSVYEAYMYKQMIENIDSVDMVTWMTEDVFMSEDFIDLDSQKDYYRDRCAVMDITFVEGDTADSTKEGIDQIKDLLGDKGRYAGPAIETKSLEDTVGREMIMIMAVAVLMIFAILCLTTTSWFEPVLFLSVMGIAIVLNQGSNILLGTISFLSSSVSSVLQLATSMDYSVFLLHTFVHKSEEIEDKEKAMIAALKESALPILSSAMTTFVGFIAMTSMKYRIGGDMGIVLGKSILCSVATVMFLMPSLILLSGDLIEKTKHKNIMPGFKRVSVGVYKMRYAVIAFMLIIVAPAFVAQGMNSFTYGNSALGKSKGTQVYDDTLEIEELFGRSNLYLVIVPNGSPIKERDMCEELEDLYYVKSVTGIANVLPVGIPEEIVPESITGQLRSDDYARILLYTRTETESDLAFRTSDEMRSIVEKYYPDGKLVGNTPSTQDIKGIIRKDYTLANYLSLLGVAVVVGFTFHSVLLPILVLIPINLAIFMNMAMPYLQNETFMYIALIIISCVQLGATVDYSILMTNNYIANREGGLEKKQAAIHALQQSIPSIITSGGILTVAGYGIHFISSVQGISSIGHMIGRGGFISMCMVITGVPALLTVFDTYIFKEKAIIMAWRSRRIEKIKERISRLKAAGKPTWKHARKLRKKNEKLKKRRKFRIHIKPAREKPGHIKKVIRRKKKTGKDVNQHVKNQK